LPSAFCRSAFETMKAPCNLHAPVAEGTDSRGGRWPGTCHPAPIAYSLRAGYPESIAMKLYLFRLVTLLSTVGMVLPSGWCCLDFAQVRTPAACSELAPGKSACCQRSCCQRRQPVQRSNPVRIPACPKLQCCCQRDAALPVKRVQPSHAPTLAVTVAMPEAVLASVTRLTWNALSACPEGPPTHLLQCVWRC
jgi:hypothetical protein